MSNTLTQTERETEAGFGHQYSSDSRCLNACVSDLESSLNHVWLLENKGVQDLCTKISVLIKEARELAYSAAESRNQNR